MSSAPGGTGSSSGCEGSSDVIDFRYHLVSIIAIFFALATGIILGAGPLDEQVNETLVDQIPQLRDENQLQTTTAPVARDAIEEPVHALVKRA